MKRRTLDERIEAAQEIGRQRWNSFVQREAERERREMAVADRKAGKRRSRMHVIKGGAQ